MVIPWQSPPAYSDYYAGAAILAAQAAGNLDQLVLAMTAVAPGSVIALEPGTLNAALAYQISDDYVTVALGGTTNILQLLGHLLGSIQQQIPNVPGHVNSFFAANASAVRTALDAVVIPALATRRLVLLGFSFGAGIAQILLSQWGPSAARGAICICYGSPRVGDPTFAGAVGAETFRVNCVDDPIPALPPVAWAGVGSPWGPFVGLVPATYADAGTPALLDSNGRLAASETVISFSQACQMVAADEVQGHYITTYLTRLTLQIPPPPPPVVWEDPVQLNDEVGFLLGSLPPFLRGPGVANLTIGTLFFRTNEESQGWGESWFANTDVPTMLASLQALAPTRASLLASDCEIHAIRAAVSDTPGVKSSKALRLSPPISGAASNNIKGGDAETNETMDAIDMMVISQANASRRVYPFRGVPDTWITGSQLTAAGRKGVVIAQAYIDQAKAAGLGFRVYNRANPFVPIQGLSQDAGSELIQLNVPLHGFPQTGLCTLRRVKSNAMLNGRWKYIAVDANTLRLLGSQRFFASSGADGTVQQFGATTDNIADRFFNAVSTRKTGRPFGMRRGKRSGRLLHH